MKSLRPLQLSDQIRESLGVSAPAPVIRGDKGGGGSQHTPTEASDSLRSTAYATILDLVSEGEIEGWALGADKMGQCIALDGTLLENPDGSRNFQNVSVDSRSGTETQDYIQGVPDVENSIGVGVELKSGTPWVSRVSNSDLSAVRVIMSVPNGLQQSDQSTGDITGYTVGYKIDLSVDDGAYVTMFTGAFTGKASGKYQRAHRINLPACDDHWNVRVTRTTPNANSALIADRTDIDAIVDIVDKKLAYPNSALVSVSVDASQFSSIPTRAYLLKGRIVRIPSNYDPVARTYTGTWDGTFKPGFTDNPAWAFFDMATHKRYGLGKYLTDARVDKWSLYTIAQYCDQLVDDGNGGLEPRFACSLYLQTGADAYKVMQDMATMFRGISYYSGSAIQAVADMPADPVYVYDNSNVIGGKFSYSGSSLTSRKTVALVSWNDVSDFGKAKVEPVKDQPGIDRYGIRTTEVTAIGCATRAGAVRVGKHILLTNRLETEAVSFGIGLDGEFAAPGQIVKIVDHNRAGKRQGGRIKSATASAVTVDAAPEVAVGDTLTVNMPDGVGQTRTVSAVDGLVISVAADFTEAPRAESVWTVESSTLAAQTFRVVSVVENSDQDETLGFTVSCIQHAPEKFAAIDGGVVLTPRPITSLASPTQDAVTDLAVTRRIVYRQGAAVVVLHISWTKPSGAVEYDVYWRRDNGSWTSAGEVETTSVDVENVYAGMYQAKVIAYNANGVPSVPVVSSGIQIDGKNIAPPAPTLHAEGGFLQIALTWDFPTTVNVSDTSYTEIEVSSDSSMASATSTKYAYPLNNTTIPGLGVNETWWMRGRLVDKSGNIGAWSAPISATTDTTDELFLPIQGEVDDLQDQADATLAQVQTLQGQLGDVMNADVWDVAKTYPLGDLVQESGKLYRSLLDNNTGNDPATSPTQWELIGNYASLGEAVGAVAANVAVNNNKIAQQGDDITAQSQSISENTTALGTKADASALQATNSTVSQQGDEITASAADIALIGAHNAGKTAFLLSQSTVQIGTTGQSFSQYMQSVQITAANDAQARVDSETSARISADNLKANATDLNAIAVRMPSGTGVVATKASVDVVTSTANSALTKITASYTLSLDVDGKVVGVVAQNNGAVGSLVFNFDDVQFINGAGSVSIIGGITVKKAGSYMAVDGPGFGVGGDLIEWYGPIMAVGSCSKANAVTWKDNAGNAYFGGSLSAGTLKNAVTSTLVSGGASVETGVFGTNGNSKVVVCSLGYNNFGLSSNDIGNGATSATVTLQRSYNGGAWTTIGSFTATGNKTSTYNSELGKYNASCNCGGSLTVTDNQAGTGTFNYRAVISGATNWPVVIGVNQGNQTLSVISTEQ